MEPIATGQVGDDASAPKAKKADRPAVQPATVTCFVRSASEFLFDWAAKGGGVVSFIIFIGCWLALNCHGYGLPDKSDLFQPPPSLMNPGKAGNASAMAVGRVTPCAPDQ
jgi:hypothetical protein